MRPPEEEVIASLREHGVSFTASLPCERIKGLLEMVEKTFYHVPLTREEEGVGICAGAALSGKRPALFVQSSGIGNMVNALLSLTQFYELPLAIFVSRRGLYKEKIEAQIPMGKRLPSMLGGAGIPHTAIDTRADLALISKRLHAVYSKNLIHAFLLNPALWEGSAQTPEPAGCRIEKSRPVSAAVHIPSGEPHRLYSPRLTRYEVLNRVAPYLDSRAVVCNLGIPSKELYHLRHQPSNFYMLGSMGMATPIGIGMALTSRKSVVVIDGDGSLLMNPGSLATAAFFSPWNLLILAIDNGSYGSTGDQPTLTRSCVDLALVARGFGIKNTVTVSTAREISSVMKRSQKELTFLHAIALPGNRDVPNIPLHHLDIKREVMRFLQARAGS